MKKISLTFILFFLLLTLIKAQQNEFQMNFGTDLGFSKIIYNDESLNTSTYGAELNAQYGISKFINLETGLNYFQTQGNLIILGKSNFVENSYLLIPLGLNAKFNITNNTEATSQQRLSILLATGLYANHLTRIKVENRFSESNLGWTMGAYGKIGMHCHVNSIFSLDIGLKFQSDFSAVDKNEWLKVEQNRKAFFINFGFKL